ncbi:uncharacterized protein LOC132257975 [Phlebotomus argentipes]|uniref:uncharacterized protein LOC132257975 n=1 Tax=Phlebotomus argentipes TaxID=94469 RepID=UPI002892A26B|nr:uncharacterized protein LOC132257975 [Phlebotomus argentipes]
MKWVLLLVLMPLCRSLMNISEVGERQRRYLIYPPNGGLVKIILGISAPIVLSGKRSMGCAYNLQGQFRVPSEVMWRPVTFEGLSRKARRELEDIQANSREDESRKLLYFMLERFKNWAGKNGRECLLRTICEVTQSPLTEDNGIFGELIDSIFIPGDARVDQHFQDAHRAGRAGINCLKVYKNCPMGDGFLDQFVFS